jgi:hypothetical protein
MSVLLVLIGSSIGPAISAIYLLIYQEIAKGVCSGSGGSFSPPLSYNLIFLTATLISAISIGFVIFLKRMITSMMTQSQTTMKKSAAKENIYRIENTTEDCPSQKILSLCFSS